MFEVLEMVLSSFWSHVHSHNPYVIGVPWVFNECLSTPGIFVAIPKLSSQAAFSPPGPAGKFVPEGDFRGEWSMRELAALLCWISSARAEDKPRGEDNCTQQYFVFKCQH